MRQEVYDEGHLRRYLLGELNEEEQQAVEERLLTDDESFDLLLAAEDELIDDYASGALSAEERKGFEGFFLSTSERQRKLRFAMALRRYITAEAGAVTTQAESAAASSRVIARPSPVVGHLSLWWKQAFSSPYLRMAAAAVIVIGLGLGIWRVFFYQSEVSKGTAALAYAYRDQRPLEARISGFKYAPASTTRGGEAKVDRTARNLAESSLLDAVLKHPNAATHHAAGRLYLAEKKFDEAIEQFEEAIRTDPNNAQLRNDYGVGLLEKGKQARLDDDPGGSLREFARSLDQLNKALDLDSSLLEVRFNRAILYENMALSQQAAEEWRRYLEKDSYSKWAEEASQRLKQIEEKRIGSLQNDEPLREFVKAFQSRSNDKALELMSRNTEAISGKLLWWELVGAYLESSLRRAGESASEYFQALSYAGKLQEQKTGDRFIPDLARFYGSLTSDGLGSLASAHTLIDKAHVLLAKSETDRAIEFYARAKDIFERNGDQLEARFAGYWVSYGHYRKSEFKRSLSGFSQLAEQSRRTGHLGLLARALTMVANIQAESDEFSSSLACYQESLEISERMNDEYNVQKNLTSLAYNFKNLGDCDESLSFLQRGLEGSAKCWPGARQMYRNFDTAAGIFNTFGYYAAAAEYEQAALQQAVEAGDPVFEHRSYTHLSALYSELQNYAEALSYAERSYETATTLLSERADPRSVALSSLQLAHIYRQSREYDRAVTHYDDAIRRYQDINLVTFLYEAHKGRLLCYIGQGNDELAETELQVVLAFFEDHRDKIKEEKNRNSFFDLQQYVYDIAIDFEHSREHDDQKAFEYSETSRARSLLDQMRAGARVVGRDAPAAATSLVSQPRPLDKIREGMPEQVQILQYAVLDDKLLMWVVSKNRFEVVEEKITANELSQKVLDYWRTISSNSNSDHQELQRKAMALYEILIKPVKPLLLDDHQICIIPDKILNYMAFDALVAPDTGNYLVREHELSFAPSSNTLLVCSEEASGRSGTKDEKALSVGNPYFDRKAFPGLDDLPDSGREAEKVARCYKSAVCLVGENAVKERITTQMGSADVIHLASHYVVDEHNPMLSKLLLTSRDGGRLSDGLLQGSEIYNKALSVTRLVSLSACRSGIERYYKGEGMIGMSRAFLAAGVPLIAGSLWPVDSTATADLMISFHTYRAHGLSSVAALRHAQLDMIDKSGLGRDAPYYWAPFVIIGGYASF